MGSTLYKLTIIIILDRLKKWYNEQLLDQQQGFRSGRGTADCVFITKRIQQISEGMKKPIYALFIDLSAAFDHIIRSWLFKSISLSVRQGGPESPPLYNLYMDFVI